MKISFCNFYHEHNLNNKMFESQNAKIGDDLFSPMHAIARAASNLNIEVGTICKIDSLETDAIIFIDMPII